MTTKPKFPEIENMTEDIEDGLTGANSPAAGNVFATIADLGGIGGYKGFTSHSYSDNSTHSLGAPGSASNVLMLWGSVSGYRAPIVWIPGANQFYGLDTGIHGGVNGPSPPLSVGTTEFTGYTLNGNVTFWHNGAGQVVFRIIVGTGGAHSLTIMMLGFG